MGRENQNLENQNHWTDTGVDREFGGDDDGPRHTDDNLSSGKSPKPSEGEGTGTDKGDSL